MDQEEERADRAIAIPNGTSDARDGETELHGAPTMARSDQRIEEPERLRRDRPGRDEQTHFDVSVLCSVSEIGRRNEQLFTVHQNAFRVQDALVFQGSRVVVDLRQPQPRGPVTILEGLNKTRDLVRGSAGNARLLVADVQEHSDAQGRIQIHPLGKFLKDWPALV